MIIVKLDKNGIAMDGHAGHRVNGQDIVCSAVSALTCTLANALQELTQNTIVCSMDSGYTRIYWDDLDHDGQLLLNAWKMGLEDINQLYDCIEYAEDPAL